MNRSAGEVDNRVPGGTNIRGIAPDAGSRSRGGAGDIPGSIAYEIGRGCGVISSRDGGYGDVALVDQNINPPTAVQACRFGGCR